MANSKNNLDKVVISAEVYPFEKEAYLKWIQGKYHSVAEALRCHIRKVTGLDPENQGQNTPESKIFDPMATKP